MAATQSASNDLVAAVIEAAGGQERFGSVQSFEVSIIRRGLLFSLKGYPAPINITCYVDTKQPRVVFHDFGGHHDEPNLRWIWTPDKVWNERPNGKVLQSQENPRETLYVGHTLRTPWEDLQILYFSGYALWNYFMAPFYFTWSGFETRELKAHAENDQTWRVLEVTYPNHFPTHCKTQRYYYDSNFQLRRLDYSVDVIPGTSAAHYAFDEEAVDGLMVPKLRRVLSNRGQQPSGPSMVLLNFQEIVVRKETDVAKL